MTLLKLTAFASLAIGLIAGLAGCEKESEKDKVNQFTNDNIPFSGAQIAPVPSPSAATGNLKISYDKRSKVLNYTITWSGLSDSVMAIRLSGPAPSGFGNFRAGYAPASLTADTTSPYNVLQQITGSVLVASNSTLVTSTKKLGPTGSYSSSLLIDGVRLKEEDLLNSNYYFTIHPKTVLPGTPPNSLFFRWYGEIRAQVKFN
jgi:CHRD domain